MQIVTCRHCTYISFRGTTFFTGKSKGGCIGRVEEIDSCPKCYGGPGKEGLIFNHDVPSYEIVGSIL